MDQLTPGAFDLALTASFVVVMGLVLYAAMRLVRQFNAHAKAEEERRRTDKRRTNREWYPEELELYLELQHCGSKAEGLAHCVLCTAQLSNVHQHLDEHHSFWRCPICNQYFWRHFFIDINASCLMAISGTWVVTHQIPEVVGRRMVEEIQRCPNPYQAEDCACPMHRNARESNLSSIAADAAWASREEVLEWKSRQANHPDGTTKPLEFGQVGTWWRELVGTDRDRYLVAARGNDVAIPSHYYH